MDGVVNSIEIEVTAKLEAEALPKAAVMQTARNKRLCHDRDRDGGT